MLELFNIHTYYGESHILHGISLRVKPGLVVALLGRNGMGKTTTIRSIMGLTAPRHGSVYLEGKDITRLKPYQIARRGISLVPQGKFIFSLLSVEENLTMSARTNRKSNAWCLDSIFALFPILKIRSKQRGNFLSGGEQQMLAIGRAMMTNPDVLLMDEPSEGLAPMVVQEITQITAKLKQSGMSILLVEQNYPMVLSLSDYAYILSKGQIVYESSTKELIEKEQVIAKHLSAMA